MREKARDLFDLFFLLRISKFDEELAEKKLKIFNIKYNKAILENNINKIKYSWEKELKPFVLTELPSFTIVKKFVLNRI